MNKEDIEFVEAMIKDASAEMEQYKNESEFNKGAAFAYKCVLNMLKDFGGIENETN